MKVSAIPFREESFTQTFRCHKSYFVTEVLDDPYVELNACLKKLDIILSEDNNCETLIDISQTFKAVKKPGLYNESSKKICISLEPPVGNTAYGKKSLQMLTNVYDYVLSTYEDYVDNRTIFKINNPYCFDFVYTPICEYKDKKLATLVAGNNRSVYPLELYSKRKEAIRYFETCHPSEFDMYGKGWSADEYPSYKGAIKGKFEVYQQYKFAVCFENNICHGGITEKIFDCFLCRCVPVYLGSVNILDYIPEGCFIDYRQFANMEEMYQFLVQMPEEQYNSYIENIEAYLESPQKDVFSPEYFAEQIYKTIILPKRHTDKVKQRLWAVRWRLHDLVGVFEWSDLPILCARIRSFVTRAYRKLWKILKNLLK